MRLDTILKEEIESEFKELKKLEVGSEKYKIAVDSLTKLMDKAIEMDRFDTELQDKLDAREIEYDLKAAQFKDEKKDRKIKNVLTGVGIGLPVLVTIWGTVVSLNFEKEGTVTTIMGRGFISKLLPKK